ncbi:MAG: RNA polymerase sigma factor [Thermomicrobiales bacterium]|nr:RNA polymerase sigma factor [Thermomicrobiales bacterium]
MAASVLGRREQADDVLQEAAMIALGKLDEFDANTSFEAWMAQVVRFVALNAARKHARREGRITHSAAEPSAPESVGSLRLRRDGSVPGDQSVFDDRVVRALESLPEVARTCLLLRAVEGLSYREIAALLAVPEGTAMSHVHRARTAMRRSLEQGGER